MKRLAPKLAVVRRLFALSGNMCAFPGCQNHLIDEDGTFIAEVAHIAAAKPGGERYSEDQSDEDRRSFENLMILCHQHHKITDDVDLYSATKLREMKAEHESKFLSCQYNIPEIIESEVFESFQSKFDLLFQLGQSTLSAVQEGNEVVKKTGEVVDSMAATLRDIQSALAIDTAKIHADQLEFIKSLRKEHKPQTALNMLRKYREEHWNKIGSELQYKLLANMGALLLELGKKEEGAKQFIELKNIEFASVDKLAYECLGYAILDMKEEFGITFEETRRLQADKVNLWIAYIHIQDTSVAVSEIESKIPVSVLEKPEILYTLGEALIDRNEEERGFEMLEKSVAISGDAIEDKWHLLGILESKRLMRIATMAKIAFKQFTADEIKNLKKSRDVFATVWKYASKTEHVPAAWYAVLNKGIINKILGDNLAAEEDLEEAWRVSHAFIAFKDLICHYVDINRLDKAALLLYTAEASGLRAEDSVDFAFCEARLYSAQEMPEKAVEALLKEVDAVSGDDRLKLLDLIILTYFQHGAFDKALPYAQRVVAEFKDRPEGFLELGTCYRMLQMADEALASFDIAMQKATNDDVMPHIWHQLGIEYSHLGQHRKAIACFKKACSPVGYGEIHRRLLYEYHQVGDYQNAIELAIKVLTIIPNDAHAHEILFRSYQDAGEIEEAKETLQTFLENGDKEALDHFRVLGVDFYNRIGKLEEAVKLILEIQDFKKLSLSQRFWLARQLIVTDKVVAGLEIAFDARLDHYNEAQAHDMYISCSSGGKEQENQILYPTVVEMDCGISLIDQSQKYVNYFLTNDERYPGANILRSTHKWTGSLIGKSRGEAINIPNSVGIGSTLTIGEIMNKHVYAFRESLELLETIFSGETDIKFLRWQNDEGFSILTEFFKKQALESQQARREMFQLYSKAPVTVGMLANKLGRNFIEMWFDLIGNKDVFLESYTHDERMAVSRAITEAKWVVVDPIALLTNTALLADFNLLSVFAGRCIVAQSIVTEMKLYKQQLELPGPSLSVGIEEGELRKHEYTQEATNNTIKLVESAIQWCESSAVIRVPVKGTKENRPYDFDIIPFIGQPFHDSVLLANELEGALLSDDERLKSFALGQYNLNAFSSYQLGVHKANGGLLSAQEFRSLALKLVRFNYAYIPITGKELWDLFDDSEFKLIPPFSNGVRGLRIMLPIDCANSLANFAKTLYLNISIISLREQAMLYALQEAKRNTNFELVRSFFLQILEREFRLMPVQKSAVLNLINNLSVQT